MNFADLINAIALKHPDNGITLNPPASPLEIEATETRLRFQLPADFKEFYLLCNGFECKKDLFNLLGVAALFRDNEYGDNCIIFAEHTIYSDVWALRKLYDDTYEIFYTDGEEIILTNSLTIFLEKLLHGHVSEQGGLFEWHNEIRRQ